MITITSETSVRVTAAAGVGAAGRQKLSVKELAGPVGVTVSFLYKARMVGLPMSWNVTSRCYEATPGSVRRWIKRTGFKVINGKPQRDGAGRTGGPKQRKH